MMCNTNKTKFPYLAKRIENQNKSKMFLVTEERLRNYAPPIQILMLAVALVGVILFFYYSFWETTYKIVFTDEPRQNSDYAAFALGIANIIVIVSTVFRLLRHSAEELKKKLK